MFAAMASALLAALAIPIYAMVTLCAIAAGYFLIVRATQLTLRHANRSFLGESITNTLKKVMDSVPVFGPADMLEKLSYSGAVAGFLLFGTLMVSPLVFGAVVTVTTAVIFSLESWSILPSLECPVS